MQITAKNGNDYHGTLCEDTIENALSVSTLLMKKYPCDQLSMSIGDKVALFGKLPSDDEIREAFKKITVVTGKKVKKVAKKVGKKVSK